MLSIALSAYLASDRSADLAANSLRVRMDALAEEIERSAAPMTGGLTSLSEPILENLTLRFPDPLVLVDTTGSAIRTLYPDPQAFLGPVSDSTVTPEIPDAVVSVLEAGDVRIERGSDDVEGGWAAVPLYDATGFLVGGFVIQPITRTMYRELEPTRRAFRTATWTVGVVSILVALVLATAFTWWLIRPLRRITDRVLEIGAGNYDTRIQVRGSDEIARLGRTVNRMADQVAASLDALRATDRMRRDLIANVGHDLRTPLAALKGHLEEGLRFFREERENDALRALASAGSQAEYLQRLVDDLFELSQLDSPSPRLRLEPVPVAELLSEAGRNHAGPMQARSIAFYVELPESLPVIEADGTRIMRILDNLLSNARRHANAGDTVRLSAEVAGEEVQILVSDTGEGMDEVSLERIFDRYYRGEASRTRDPHGTGLGLAIARAVAELHGGRLTADSAPGAGTRMRLVLPLGGPRASGPQAPGT
jgi:signal transduction histidine kinase